MGYRVGLSILDRECPVSQGIMQSFQQAATVYPEVDVLLRYSEHDEAQVLAHAALFVSAQVDVAIVQHYNAHLLEKVRAILFPITLIAVDVSVPLVTYVGRDFKRCGWALGDSVIEWVGRHWDGKANAVIATLPESAPQLMEHTVQPMLAANLCHADSVHYLRTRQEHPDEYGNAFAALLNRQPHSHRIIGIAHNQPAMLTMLDVVRELRRENTVILAGHAVNSKLEQTLKQGDALLAAATSCPSRQYGTLLMDLVIRKFNGEHIPAQNYISFELLTPNA